jgi:hypothetical protein
MSTTKPVLTSVSPAPPEEVLRQVRLRGGVQTPYGVLRRVIETPTRGNPGPSLPNRSSTP